MPRARGEKLKPWARANAARSLIDPNTEWAENIASRVIAGTHPKQRAFVEDPGRRVVGLCSRGAGKTTGGIARFVLRMVRTRRARCLFVAATKDSARELIWDKLQETVSRLGIEATFAEVSLRVTFKKTGSTLRLVGSDDEKDINKLRGKSFHEVGIDEAGFIKDSLLKNLIYRVLGPRLGDYNGVLWAISTPGSQPVGLFYDVTRQGGEMHRAWELRDQYPSPWNGWSSHFWTLWDGAKHVPAIARELAEAQLEKEANKWSDDNPIWRREYLAQWAADNTNNIYHFKPRLEDGTLWNVWNPERIGGLLIGKLPEGRNDWLYVLGADMGSSDPFALHVLAASPTDPERRIYHLFEFYRPKMYARLIAELLLGPELSLDRPGGVIGAIGWPAAMVADMSHLGGSVLDELAHVYGIRFTAAERAKGAKLAAIETMNGDLIDGRFVALEGSELAKQLIALQWKANEFGMPEEGKGDANHACFIAGTMIRTPDGEHPIETIEPGTLVWTRSGPRVVTAAWCSGERDLWTLFDGVNRLTGTANHPIWTDAGWKDLGLLTPDDMITTWASTDHLKLQCSAGRSTGGTRSLKTDPCGSTSLPATESSSIAPSGQRYVVRYHEDFISITPTATRSTTESPTCGPSPHRTTHASTWTTLDGGTLLARPSAPLAKQPRSGTNRPSVSNGTEVTESQRPHCGRTSIGLARSVVPRSRPRTLTRVFAVHAVMPKNGGTLDAITPTSDASIARSHSAETDSPNPAIARRSVAEVRAVGERALVYNITVADEHEYFANGVLVSNCDAAVYGRQAIATLLGGAAPPPKAPTLPGIAPRPPEVDEGPVQTGPDSEFDASLFDDRIDIADGWGNEGF